MRVRLYHGEALAAYGFGSGHPFGHDRQAAFWQEALRQGLDWQTEIGAPVPGTEDDLALFHSADYIARVRFKHIWVTEASNNKAGTSVADKGKQYLQCWQELQKRPTVQGVTFFVASASNPDFAEEVWVGRGIGAIVGKR